MSSASPRVLASPPSSARSSMSNSDLKEWMAKRRDCCEESAVESMPGQTIADARNSPKKSRRGQSRATGRLSVDVVAPWHAVPDSEISQAGFKEGSDWTRGTHKHNGEADQCINAKGKSRVPTLQLPGASGAASSPTSLIALSRKENTRCVTPAETSASCQHGHTAHTLRSGDFRRAPAACWIELYALFAPSNVDVCAVAGTGKLLNDYCPPCAECESSSVRPLTDTEAMQVKPLDFCCASCSIAATSFVITLAKSDGDLLGVDVICSGDDSTPLIINAVTGGLIQTWNAEHPNQQVKRGDRLVEANGMTAQIQLVQECRKMGQLDLRLARPSEDCQWRRLLAEVSKGRVAESLLPIGDFWSGRVAQCAESPLPASCTDAENCKCDETTEHPGPSSPSARHRSLPMPRPPHHGSQQQHVPCEPMPVSGKVHSGLGYMKKQVEGVPGQVSEEVQKRLGFVKGQAQVASAAIKGQTRVASAAVKGQAASAQVASAAVKAQVASAAVKGHALVASTAISERAQVASAAVKAQVPAAAVKAQVASAAVKGHALVASTGGKMSERAQKGLNFARRLGKPGGA